MLNMRPSYACQANLCHAAHRREAVAEYHWFDWVMAVLAAWLLGGAFIDGWAHHLVCGSSGKSSQTEPMWAFVLRCPVVPCALDFALCSE